MCAVYIINILDAITNSIKVLILYYIHLYKPITYNAIDLINTFSKTVRCLMS